MNKSLIPNEVKIRSAYESLVILINILDELWVKLTSIGNDLSLPKPPHTSVPLVVGIKGVVDSVSLSTLR